MRAEAFRQYLRTNTNQPLTERTVEKYVSDIEDIEGYCSQNLDTISISSLSNLVGDLGRYMPNLSVKSVRNYRSPAHHYIRFRQQSE